MLSIYPACFFTEDKGYAVVFPDLNYLATQGETLEEAMRMAVDCLAGYLYSCQIDGMRTPPASALKDVNIGMVARELDCAEVNKDSFVNLIAVDVAAYAREHFTKTHGQFAQTNKLAETF